MKKHSMDMPQETNATQSRKMTIAEAATSKAIPIIHIASISVTPSIISLSAGISKIRAVWLEDTGVQWPAGYCALNAHDVIGYRRLSRCAQDACVGMLPRHSNR